LHCKTPCFILYIIFFYVNGTKIVPNIIGVILTDVSLAYRVQDDGSKTGSGFYLNKHSYTYSEHLLLKEVLWPKLHLDCNIHS
jgi:LAGLIDADG DNA endonuclease family